jgi:ribosomal protein S18 acetylase RimI-like enzyme
MIEFRKIENSSDLLFSKIYGLYENTFPAVERRSAENLKQVLNHNKAFEMDALMIDDGFVGFFNFWKFDDFVFGEHFAVDPKMRGKNIGSEVVQALCAKVNLPVVLEVELPEDEFSIRRINFYERLGFRVLPYNYAQPHYDGSRKMLPLLLMSNDYDFSDKHFGRIKKTVYKGVYDFEE